MGAQQTKDRALTSGSLTVRNIKCKPRFSNIKDGKNQGLNIFTEHSGECKLSAVLCNNILQFLILFCDANNNEQLAVETK